jgi:hypothetical protein
MGCLNSTAQQSPDMYLDPGNVLRKFDPSSRGRRVGSEELAFVASQDTNKVNGGEEFYLISVSWLSNWMNFANGNVVSFSDRIDNKSLIDPANDQKLRATARFKKEYRVIEKSVWNFYFEVRAKSFTLNSWIIFRVISIMAVVQF